MQSLKHIGKLFHTHWCTPPYPQALTIDQWPPQTFVQQRIAIYCDLRFSDNLFWLFLEKTIPTHIHAHGQ